MASDKGFKDLEGLGAEEVINALGGIRPAAAKLSVPVTTVQGWKNRGRIPENRRDAIQVAITKLGVETYSPASAAGSKAEMRVDIDRVKASSDQTSVPKVEKSADIKESGPTSDLQNEKVIPMRGARGMAAFALVLSILSTACVAVLVLNPSWLANATKYKEGPDKSVVKKLSGEVNRDFFKGSQSFKAILADHEKLQDNLQSLEKKVAGILKEVGAASVVRDGAIEGSLEQLSGEVEGSRKQIAQVQAEFQKLRAQEFNDVFRAIRSLEDARLTAEARIEGFEKSQNALGARIETLREGNTLKFDRDFALLVSLGQLEWMVRSRSEFNSAFERVRYFADGRADFVKILEGFGAKLQRGQVSDEALFDGFEKVRAQLAQGSPPPEGWGIMEGAWAQVKSFIGLRRLGPESQSLVTRVERALARKDFQTVLDATLGFGGQVNIWRQSVERRFQFEELLDRLNKKLLSARREDASSSSIAPHAGRER